MTWRPSIDVRELKPTDEYLVLASDGVWELLTSQVGFTCCQTAVASWCSYPRAPASHWYCLPLLHCSSLVQLDTAGQPHTVWQIRSVQQLAASEAFD